MMMRHHRTPSVFARPASRLPGSAVAFRRSVNTRRRAHSSPAPRAAAAAPAAAADEATAPAPANDPDPAVVRLLEAHALEASAGCFGRASAAAMAAAAASTAEGPSADGPGVGGGDGGDLDLVAAARIQAEIEAREAALVHSLLASTGRLPRQSQAAARKSHGAAKPKTTTAGTQAEPTSASAGVIDVAHGAAALSRSAGLRSAFRALQALKRNPELLVVPEPELARRTLALKLALPAADVGALVSARPSLLLLGPASVVSRVVGAAAAQINALMPGIPWQGKLAEGGTVYWSFASVLDGSQGLARALAAEEEEEEEEEAAGRGGGGRLSLSPSPSPTPRREGEEEERQGLPPA